VAVKSALPSRCLQGTVLSVSDFEINSFHKAPFPFMEGDVCISCPIVRRQLHSSSNSSWQSGLRLARFSWFFSKDATISFQRVSHAIGSVISFARLSVRRLPLIHQPHRSCSSFVSIRPVPQMFNSITANQCKDRTSHTELLKRILMMFTQ
jgi:hypothetical protein